MPHSNPDRILAIDIGGSHIKASLLDRKGNMLHDYIKWKTPASPGPGNLLAAIEKLVRRIPSFNCISAGFPGYVKKGIVMTAPNLDTGTWAGTDFRKMLEDRLGKPVRLINDADMLGLGVVSGKGLELVVTLGTGMGFAMLLDGKLLPHMELSHHPITSSKDYDRYIGDAALQKIGIEKWNKRMAKILPVFKTVFNYDTLYLGGGNVRKIMFPLDKDVIRTSNKEGIKGGARLWDQPEHFII